MTVAKWWFLLDRALKAVMAVLLFAMMTITTVDVVGRYLLNSPVPGGFEIVQYLMAVVVFASLPLTTAADSHLTVSLVGDQLRGTPRRMHRIFVLLLSSVALIVIAWRMAEQARTLALSKQVSGFLQLPLAPVAWVMAALATLAALIVLTKLAAALLGREEARTAPAAPMLDVD